MQSFTEILVYATWAAMPVIVYQALMHGMNRAGRAFAVIFALYTGAVVVTYLGVSRDVARAGFSAVSPIGVLLPWLSAVVLSGLMFWIGGKASE